MVLDIVMMYEEIGCRANSVDLTSMMKNSKENKPKVGIPIKYECGECQIKPS